MLFLLFVVTVIGSVLSGLTGLAGGAVILGGLMLFYAPVEALALHGWIMSVSNGARSLLWWRSVSWRLVALFSLMLIPGAYLGGLAVPFFSPAAVELFLGVLILLLAYDFFPTPRLLSTGSGALLFWGLVCGALSMFAGVVGPLLNPVFDRLGLKREGLVATKSACQLLLHLARITSYGTVVGVDYGRFSFELMLLVGAALLGIALSRPVGRRLSDGQVRSLIRVLLTIIGVKNVAYGSYLLLS